MLMQCTSLKQSDLPNRQQLQSSVVSGNKKKENDVEVVSTNPKYYSSWSSRVGGGKAIKKVEDVSCEINGRMKQVVRLTFEDNTQVLVGPTLVYMNSSSPRDIDVV
jgi:hypothetical protein